MESTRRVRTLFAAWIAYWTVLGATTLAPAWVAGPPLLAWLAWVFLSRERPRSREKVSG